MIRNIQLFIECDHYAVCRYQWSLPENENIIHIKEENESILTFENNLNKYISIQTDKPLPPSLPYFYFEVKVLNSGEYGTVGIGLTYKNNSKYRDDYLAERASHSITYHGEYGRIYLDNDAAVDQTDIYTTGDTVGCYFCRATIVGIQQTLVQFSKNGSALHPIRCIVGDEFYPTLVSATSGTVFETNFGQKPFMCDMNGHYMPDFQSV